MNASNPGTFVISLDFELYWGVRDVVQLKDYRQNLLGVRQAVPAMLRLFTDYELRVTWATVGLLFFDEKADMLAHLPVVRPAYSNPLLSPYSSMLSNVGEDERSDPYHFGRSLLRQIQRTPGQEIASHTFCHYYCLERGQTAESFYHDLLAAVRTARTLDMEIKSLVFPRNQFNPEYVDICRELGITSYRGNENSWIYEGRNEEQQTLYKRGARLLDAYVNLSGQHSHNLDDIARSFPYNIPASRFLRPWSANALLRPLEGLRLRRILAGMEHAAQHGLVYHLWWHPHNFGINLPQNIAILQRIADHYKALQTQYGMRSWSMADIADHLQSRVSAFSA